MNIGEASKACGVSAKMIRYYESIGLIPRVERRNNRYRQYSALNVRRLWVIGRARELGMPINRIRHMMSLWSRDRKQANVISSASDYIEDFQTQSKTVRILIGTLEHLVASRKRGHLPDGPMISDVQIRLLNRSPKQKKRSPQISGAMASWP